MQWFDSFTYELQELEMCESQVELLKAYSLRTRPPILSASFYQCGFSLSSS